MTSFNKFPNDKGLTRELRPIINHCRIRAYRCRNLDGEAALEQVLAWWPWLSSSWCAQVFESGPRKPLLWALESMKALIDAISTIHECAHDMNVTAVGIGPGLGALKSATDLWWNWWINSWLLPRYWLMWLRSAVIANAVFGNHGIIDWYLRTQGLTMVNQPELVKIGGRSR